jgi:serine/threonine protein kinase
MAPEVIKSKEYTKKIDIFSTGIIMFLLLSGGVHPLHISGESAHHYKKNITKIT